LECLFAAAAAAVSASVSVLTAAAAAALVQNQFENHLHELIVAPLAHDGRMLMMVVVIVQED